MDKILTKIERVKIALRNSDLASSLLADLALELNDIDVPPSELQSVIERLRLLRLHIEAIGLGYSSALNTMRGAVEAGSRMHGYDRDGSRFETVEYRSTFIRC